MEKENYKIDLLTGIMIWVGIALIVVCGILHYGIKTFTWLEA